MGVQILNGQQETDSIDNIFRGLMCLKRDWNIQWITGITAMELIEDFTQKCAMAYNQLVCFTINTTAHMYIMYVSRISSFIQGLRLFKLDTLFKIEIYLFK